MSKRALRRHHLKRRYDADVKKWKYLGFGEHSKEHAYKTRNCRKLCSCYS